MDGTAWFEWRSQATSLAPVVYEPWMVLLSIVIACAGGVASLQLVSMARRPDLFGNTVSRLAFALASLTMGVSVWAMHFIGMLAADICQPVRYDPWITALSALPSVAASAVGLRIYGHRQQPTWRDIAVGGFWVGAGIGAMHYTGMAAMRMSSTLRYDPLWFALSVLVAVVLAIAGLGARQWLHRVHAWPRWVAVVAGGVLLGLATSGMHYTAMHASLFIGPVDLAFSRWSGRQWELALAVAVVVPLVLGFAWGVLGLVSYRTLLQRLQNQTQTLHDVIDNLPGAALRFAVKPDGSYEPVLASRRLQEVTGLSIKDYKAGKWTLRDLVHPDDLPHARDALLQAVQQPCSTRALGRLRHHALGWRYVLMQASGRQIGSQRLLDLYLFDVTDEHTLRQREQALLAAIDAVVFRAELSADGVFTHVNARLAQALGYEPAELVGQPHSAVWVDDENHTTMQAFWQALRSGQAQAGVFRRRTRDGRVVHLSGWYQPLLDIQGEARSVLKLAFDLTEQVHLVESLRQTQRELQDALASRSAFFANVSHEIRTPMNAIIGFAELLRERLPAGTQEHEHVRLILEAARGLLRIINDVLDAAKLERGEFKIVEAPFRLDRLLHDLISQFGVLAARKQISLRLDWPSDPMETCWRGDSDRIRQILTNLLGNAIKFTERGGVTLGVRRCERGVQLWVEDTGIGIAPDRQSIIFDAFVQADEGTARHFGGTGLGLNIVKRLVECMGGQVSLRSELGRGTLIEVELPVVPIDEQLCGETIAAAPRPTLERALHVLAADDVQQNRELLTLLLQRDGHLPTVVDSGEALLQRYTAQPNLWDVVLLDLHMPDLDGLQTCQRLRQWEREHGRPPVPVYALTASVMDSDRAAVRKAGMDGFLEKPIDPQALHHALREAYGKREQSTPVAPAPGDSGHGAPAAPTAASTADTPLADEVRGTALWGTAWRAQVQRWLQQQAAGWAQAPSWGADEWHRVAGAAANLALPRLVAVARACERAVRTGTAAPCSDALQAWRDTLAWAGVTAGQPASAAGPYTPRVPLPAELHQRVLRACQWGEVDEAVLDALHTIDSDAAAAVRAWWNAFDFDVAAQAVQHWPVASG